MFRHARNIAGPTLHDICGQAALVRAIFIWHHQRLAHSRVTAQCVLHLARLDAKAANFELLVGAAHELDVAVRQHAREVASAVEPRARAVVEGARDGSARQ